MAQQNDRPNVQDEDSIPEMSEDTRNMADEGEDEEFDDAEDVDEEDEDEGEET